MAKYEYDHPSVRVASEGFLALGGSDNKVRLYTDGSSGLKLVEKWSKHKFPIHSLCVVKEAGVFSEDSVGILELLEKWKSCSIGA